VNTDSRKIGNAVSAVLLADRRKVMKELEMRLVS